MVVVTRSQILHRPQACRLNSVRTNVNFVAHSNGMCHVCGLSRAIQNFDCCIGGHNFLSRSHRLVIRLQYGSFYVLSILASEAETLSTETPDLSGGHHFACRLPPCHHQPLCAAFDVDLHRVVFHRVTSAFSSHTLTLTLLAPSCSRGGGPQR